MIAGAVTIRLDEAAGHLHVIPPAPGRRAAGLVGRSRDEVLRLVPLLFNLCQGAHRAAASLALTGRPVAHADRVVAADILRDHLFQFLHRWPAAGLVAAGADALVRPPAAAVSSADEARRLLGDLEAVVFGEPTSRFLERDDPVSWCAGRPTTAAAVLDAVLAAGWADLGALPLDRDGAVARVADHPAVASLCRDGAAGLAARMTARLVETARLAEALAAEAVPDRYRPHLDGTGVARAEAPRGTLYYSAIVKADRVLHLEITTPSDRMLEPGGALEAVLAAAAAARPVPPRAALSLLVESLDPCCPVEWETAALA